MGIFAKKFKDLKLGTKVIENYNADRRKKQIFYHKSYNTSNYFAILQRRCYGEQKTMTTPMSLRKQ